MKKFLSITLSLLLAASAPLSALAETYDLAQGSITVEARADGNQYVSQENGVTGEMQTTETVINQTDSDTTSTDNTITIKAEENQTAEVTISDVNIDVSGTGDPWNMVPGDAAISAEGAGNVTIELEGDNTVASGTFRAGVEKNNSGNLTITDTDEDGALEAIGGAYGGAGIGGRRDQSADNITIEGSAEVKADGGYSASGIGGGRNGNGSNITIKDDAQVEANGGENGAGIGGGDNGFGSNIIIEGDAQVEANGGAYGAGIGGGWNDSSINGSSSDITIGGNAQVNANGGEHGAGIGGGYNSSGSDITIKDNAQVNANGGAYGAGIGGGELLWGNNGNGSDITIEDNAQVSVAGGKNASGIGGGAGGNGEIAPNTDGLTTGSVGYYAPGADKSQDAPEKLLHNDGSGVHTHTGVTLQSSTEATCLNNATVTYLCSCGETVTMEQLGTVLGHIVASYSYNNDATCVADGTETGVCTRCKQNVVRTKAGSRDPNKHSLSGYVSNSDATCMADGTKTAHCTNTGCTYSVTVTDTGSALNHDFRNYVSDGNTTCEKDGTKTAKCVRYGKGGCTATDTVTDTGSALKHDFKDYVSNGDATCEQDGTKTAKCVRYGKGGCTATDTIPDVDSKLGHDFTDYIYNDDASYTEDGTETAHCNHTGCTETDTRRAEGTRWSPFQVKDEKGWYVAYTESRSGNVLTITVNQSEATLSGTIAGLRALQLGGIATIIFKTTEAESTFNISDLLAGANYTLTHQATMVSFTLDGNDAVNLLK